MSILKVEGLGHAYGRYQVIHDISLELQPGELTALIGPNGAGKTTFYNAVSGKFRPTRGRIFLDGRETTGLPAHKLVSLGLLRSFQITNIFPDMAVIENVLVPLVLQHGKGYAFFGSLRREKALFKRAEAVLDKIGLLGQAYRKA
ncbi:MAG: ATP-binding cassette domain-containing protein, partial [Desulfobacterales bacterium]